MERSVAKTRGWLIRYLVLAAVVLMGFGATVEPQLAEARNGYPKWLKHGTTYRVDGNFGPYKQSFTVRVSWKGTGFVIHTPLGTHRLKRSGDDVAFEVYFDKAWASVTWTRSRAFVVYKGQNGAARVHKLDAKGAQKTPGKRKQNFNLR